MEQINGMVSGDLWDVLRPLIAPLATQALNSGLCVRRLPSSLGKSLRHPWNFASGSGISLQG